MIEKPERVCYTGTTGSQSTHKRRPTLPFSEGLTLQTKEERRIANGYIC